MKLSENVFIPTFPLDTDESAELFKTQIYSQTGVPPERQKIMVKGGILKV